MNLASSILTHSWLVEAIDDDIIETALAAGITQLCPRAINATEASIKQAISKGLTVRGQGVKTNEHVRLFYEAGALGTTANWPDRAKELLLPNQA